MRVKGPITMGLNEAARLKAAGVPVKKADVSRVALSACKIARSGGAK